MNQWAYATLTALAVVLTLLLIRRLLSGYLRRLARRTTNRVDDGAAELVQRTHLLVMVAVGAEVATTLWFPDTEHAQITRVFLTLALLYQLGRWVGHLLRRVAEQRTAVALAEARPADATLWEALRRTGQGVLWVLLGVLALDNLGVHVGALLTGLGIGGVAVGLAVQNILGDLFASLSILIDKPFLVGDFLVVDDLSGTVEHIGWKTTRIRAYTGEQVVLANAGLLSRRIRNLQRMTERRVVIPLTVTHACPLDRLDAVPGLARAVIEAQAGATFERAHLVRVGADGLGFEVVYATLDAGMTPHLDVQQTVLIGLLRVLASHGIQLVGRPAGDGGASEEGAAPDPSTSP